MNEISVTTPQPGHLYYWLEALRDDINKDDGQYAYIKMVPHNIGHGKIQRRYIVRRTIPEGYDVDVERYGKVK